MGASFGPWSTGIDSDTSRQGLSSFWKRRMAMLPELAAHQGGPSRRQILHAGVLGLGMAAWPTFRAGKAVGPGAAGKGEDEDSGGLLYLYAQFTVVTEKDINRNEATEAGGVVAVDPGSGEWRMVFPYILSSFSISPDGTRIAFGDTQSRDGYTRTTNVKIAEFDRPDAPPREVCEFGDWVVWSGDGSELIVLVLLSDLGDEPRRWEHWRMNADGTNRVKLPLPESHAIMAWSPDGRWLATASSDHPEARGNHVSLVRPDGSELRRMSEQDISAHASFSPDSRRLTFVERRSIVTVNLDGTDRRRFTLAEEPNASFTGTAWSPDGRSIACTAENWDGDPEVRRGLDSDHRSLIIDTEDESVRTLRIPGAIWLGWPHWIPSR